MDEKKSVTTAKSLQDVIRAIRRHRPSLQKLGVLHLTVFGSFARSEQKRGSDIDLIVDFSVPVGLFHFIDVKNYLEEILGRQVDLVARDAIRPEFREQIEREMVHAA